MNGTELMKKTPSTLDDYIASQGSGKDTMVAHLNPKEAMLLKMMGGSGRINPRTGMLEFDEGEGGGDFGSTGDAFGWGGDVSPGGDLAGAISAFQGGDYAGGAQHAADAADMGNGYPSALAGSIYAAQQGDVGGQKGSMYDAADMNYSPGLIENSSDHVKTFMNQTSAKAKGFLDSHPITNAAFKAALGFLTGGPPGAIISLGSSLSNYANNSYNALSPEQQAEFDAGVMNSDSALAQNSGVAHGGGDIDQGASADISGQIPAYSGKTISRPGPYKFNRQMLGVSAKSIYPVKR